MNLRLARVCALLLCSGACALIYQVAWFRELRLIFGASTSASAAVMAIFMGGLGIGGFVLGKRADASKNALQMYAHLEIFVAVSAGLTPVLVMGAEAAYLATGGTDSLGTVGATAIRILLSILVLGPSTVAMGGTLPAAARAIEGSSDTGRQRVAALYGANTFGAVTGSVVATFAMLEVFGTRTTLWIAALVNALVGLSARAMSRSMGEDKVEAEAEAAAPPPSRATDDTVETPGWFPPLAAFIAGGAFMLMELVWYRMLGPLLGGSSYTFGLILGVALAGIGIGGALYARSKIVPSLHTFAFTCALEAVAIAAPYALGDRIAEFAFLTRPLASTGFGMSVLAWTFIASLVILPAAIVSGAQFPLVIGLYGEGSKSIGRDVGNAYAANTLGAIVGSLAGGFGLIPALSAPTCWTITAAALAVTAAFALALAGGARGRRLLRHGAVWASLLCGLLTVVFLRAQGPTAAWRHSGIGAGRADHFLQYGRRGFDTLSRTARSSIQWEKDGVESSVKIDNANGFSFVVNGKADGHCVVDAPTQIMSGLLGSLIHPNPKSVMVVGLGTGSTAGWLATVDSVERVDVVELEPAILEFARDCAPVNQNVMQNPKVVMHLGDARETLRTIRRRFDIVFSEPSNPYRAGISSMYTVEYYRAARERLDDQGYFIQWMQGYEVDERAVTTVLTTLKQVYPTVSVWQTMHGDLLFIAQGDKAVFDVEMVRGRLAKEPYFSATNLIWKTNTPEGVLAHYIANPGIADLVTKLEVGYVNRDDQNFLEFAFARTVGIHKSIDLDLHRVATRLRLDKPALKGELDPARLVEERWLYSAWDLQPMTPAVATTTGPLRDYGEFLTNYSQNRLKTATQLWKKLDRKPGGQWERFIVADALIRFGDPGAREAVAELPDSAERDLMTALLLYKIEPDNWAAALEPLQRGLTRHQNDPWVNLRVSVPALELAVQIARNDRLVARNLFDLLRTPFAVERQRGQRIRTRARIGAILDAKSCVQAFDSVWPPRFEEDELRLRVACYAETKDPRFDEVAKDLADLTAEGSSFLSLLPDEARMAKGPRLPESPVGAGAPSTAAPTAGDSGVRTDAGAPSDAAAGPDAR